MSMITVDDLLAVMAQSSRPVSRRTLRDWWTKGLLPRPARRSLGRGRGFAAGWETSRIVHQAAAVHELLARHSRVAPTLIRVWLLGFNVPLTELRRAWLAAIDKDKAAIRRRSDEALEDAVGRLVAGYVRAKAKDSPAARDALGTALYEAMSVFFGTGEAPEGQDLGAALELAFRYLGSGSSRAQAVEISDDDALWMLSAFENWCSLPAQRQIIRSASEHELVRARRLMQIGLGAFARERETFTASLWPAAIVFGRATIPVLVTLLRQPYAGKAVDVALTISRDLRRNGAVYASLHS